jgi:hypothetical protein
MNHFGRNQEPKVFLDKVGRCKLKIQLTHSLKAPGFNPWAYEAKAWFQSFLSNATLHRYNEGTGTLMGLTEYYGSDIHEWEVNLGFIILLWAVVGGLYNLNPVDP